jgi:hypothetical protein
MGLSRAQEVENVAMLVPVQRDVEALVTGWPSLRANLRRLSEPERWLKRKLVIYRAHQLRVPDD